MSTDRQPWRPLRRTTKDVLTVALGPGMDPVPTRDPSGDGLTWPPPSRAEVVVTSIDGGRTLTVQGVTVVSGSLGRYLRRRSSDRSWPDDTPAWVMELADDAENGAIPGPVQLCARCGYAARPDGRGGWEHTPGVDTDHRLVLSGGWE